MSTKSIRTSFALTRVAAGALLTLILGLGLGGCVTSSDGSRVSSSVPTPNPHMKVGNPYTINGVRYVPHLDPDYEEVGIASWYGPKFHAKLTANGELFDQNRLTAAHRTMPLPSLVRVTNLENGRTAVLRVNDRGPFAGNRIIDLSKRAAEVLGTKEQGLGRVRVEYLGAARLSDAIVSIGERENYAALHVPAEDVGRVTPTSALPAPRVEPRVIARAATEPAIAQVAAQPGMGSVQTQTASTGYFVRIGTFANIENVRTMRAALPPEIPVHVSSVGSANAETLHQVKLGPYIHEFAALEAKKFAEASGYSGAHIVRETQAQ